MNKLQEGIYYRKNSSASNSLCLISLKLERFCQISDFGKAIEKIWNRLARLKKGIISDLNVDPNHRKSGNLTFLIAYGSKIFDFNGCRRSRPESFDDKWNFKRPDMLGGGSVIDGSDINYSKRVLYNHLLDDYCILQFIGDNEFYTKRAVIEVWKEIYSIKKDSRNPQLIISGVYTGFQSADQRNWLGFHDGVSNLKPQERLQVIPIGSRSLSRQDSWLLNGTYLAFMRINLNLEKWQETDIAVQEKIIGRDKLTGCPLLRIDRYGRPVKDARCPVRGTSEVIDKGNEFFRDHPPYKSTIDNKSLNNSHIGRTRPIDRLTLWDKKSMRIYRQGFDSLVPSNEIPGFTAGLNFISFQNSPERLFRALTYRPISQKNPDQLIPSSLSDFTLVESAGIFLVPPIVLSEPFPGADIFLSSK